LSVEALERLELWHEQIWKESLLFDKISLMINDIFYQAEDFVLYNIQNEITVIQQLGQINSIITLNENSEK
ncbi:11810_t:CDS:2, partial [Funneliformis mosseae]